MNTTNKKFNSKQKERDRYIEDLVYEVEQDFKKRRENRVKYERQWELNINFLNGNQYCDLNSQGELLEQNKTFYWQGQNVFNHIAPIIDTRLSKFSCVTPNVSVRPKTDDDSDVAGASLAEKLLESTIKKIELNEVVKKVTVWSETCGTGFYKILWDNQGGNKVGVHNGKDVFEGEVKVLAVSPFEIFPDSLTNQEINDCASIIHAKAMSVKDVKEIYGIDLAGSTIDVQSLSKLGSFDSKSQNTIDNAVIVIERYEKPNSQLKNGRLITVAGGQLLYCGDLPYMNASNGLRTYPFVKQCSFEQAGSFFGYSVIERLIPIQRAFNAVKNRKHEFLNRLSMGILTVEDGSIDVDDLAEDGLSPGKVLVYRQGSKAPEIMATTTMSSEFDQEENKLLNEFVIISGVSDVTSSSTNASVSSGTALEILVEQDNTRLVRPAENIRQCYVNIAKQMLRLYFQFSAQVRAIQFQDNFNKTKVVYLDKRILGSDDVYLESENELLYTNRQKKEMIFKLYESGLLTDENGKFRPSIKEKVLSLLGYKELDYQKGLARLHEEKAQTENNKLKKEFIEIDEFDDHSIHQEEHTRFILSEYQDLTKEQKHNYFIHIEQHKQKLNHVNGENDDGTITK